MVIKKISIIKFLNNNHINSIIHINVYITITAIQIIQFLYAKMNKRKKKTETFNKNVKIYLHKIK